MHSQQAAAVGLAMLYVLAALSAGKAAHNLEVVAVHLSHLTVPWRHLRQQFDPSYSRFCGVCKDKGLLTTFSWARH